MIDKKSQIGIKITIYFLLIMAILFTINIFYPFSKRSKEIEIFTNKATVIRVNDSVSGVIKGIDFIERGVSYIELKGSKKIILGVARNGLYESNFIGDFLIKGDSMYKNSQSDTLFIYRKNKSYYFRIGMIINE